MKKRLLSAVVAACLMFGSAAALPQGTFTDSVSITASADTQGDFTYVMSANGKYALVTKYNNTTNTTCTVPDKLGGVPVEVIGQEVFKGKTKLQRVTVPTSLRVISNSAFENCTALTVVDGLRNTQLTSVGDYAFKGCSAMKNINFPKTLETIYLNAFENCSSMESVIGLQNTKLSGQLVATFKNCKKLNYIEFPEGVTYMESTFQGCTALYSITLPNSVVTVGAHTFDGCTNLTVVTMPANLETLGAYAFYDCAKLQGPAYMLKDTKLKLIGKECFTNCAQLKKLFLPSTATNLSYCCYGFEYKSAYDFYDCTIMLYNSGKAVESAYRTANKYWYDNFPNYFDRKVKFEYIQCTNHSYTSEVTKKPTCTASGVETFTCTECGDTYTKPISATGHHFTETLNYVVELVPATPAKNGYKKYKCENCWGQLSGGYKTVTINKKNIRLFGKSRYDTGVAIANQLKTELNASKFENFVVCDGRGFADALSASYLARVLGAPILLVAPNGDSTAIDYIKANKADKANVIIVGGTGAVSEDTVTKLKALGTSVNLTRLFGNNRYDTSNAVVGYALGRAKTLGKTIGDTVILADGRNYADALSASATGMPILLVNGAGNALNDEQKNVMKLLTGNGVSKIVIAGGEGAVSKEIENAAKQIKTTARVYGKDRYKTSVAIADHFFKTPSAATIATGTNFPDGLCGGPLGYATKCPLILTADGKGADANTYAKSKGVTTAWILGGTAVVSDSAVSEILKK